jgi:repressor LexA
MHHALCSEKEVILKRIIKTKQRILKAIQDFMEDHGYPPSIREIAKKVGLKSTKAVKVHLDNLAKQGLIDRIACQARSIRIKPKPIPIIGRVTAGLPELAFEEIEGYFNPLKWRGCFLLKVKGDSMIKKRLKKIGSAFVLKPENDAYSVIKRQFEIIGKVIGVIRKV